MSDSPTPTPPPEGPSEMVRELRRIRLALVAGVWLAAAFLGLWLPSVFIRPPAPNWQELGVIQTELRMLREEVARQRLPQLPPVVIPVLPKGADGNKGKPPPVQFPIPVVPKGGDADKGK